jgi:hypothetical protein
MELQIISHKEFENRSSAALSKASSLGSEQTSGNLDR